MGNLFLLRSWKIKPIPIRDTTANEKRTKDCLKVIFAPFFWTISNFHARIPRVCLPLTQDIEKYRKIAGSVTKKKKKLFVIGSLLLTRITTPATKKTNENTRKKS